MSNACEQRVQVQIMGAPRPYSYAWWFDPSAGEMPLQIGDRVSLPGNQVSEDGTAGTVVAVGSDYKGELKRIVGRIKDRRPNTYEVYNKGPDEVGVRRPDDEERWPGWGQGDYA